MTANLGKLDRVVRLLLGVALILAPLANVPEIWTSPALEYVSMGVGVVLAVTAVISFCPLYRLLGISSCKP